MNQTFIQDGRWGALPHVDELATTTVPAGVPKLDGMTSDGENLFLYFLTSRVWSGKGRVLEIGPWLGKSTVHLAQGLRDNPIRGGILTAVDKFEWAGESMSKKLKQSDATRLRRGDDFLQLFKRNVDEYREIVQPERSKINDWRPAPGPIELLILDAPKRSSDVSHVMRQIGEKVIPDTSILAWQDFGHAPSFEIAACLTDYLPNLQPMHFVEDGTMMVFGVKSGWSQKVHQQTETWRSWSVSDAIAAWRTWEDLIPEKNRPLFKAGLAFLLYELGLIEEAQVVLGAVIENPSVSRRWSRWSQSHLALRYPELFGPNFVKA